MNIPGQSDDDSVHLRGQMAVRVGDRLLIVEVGHIPHSPDNMADSELSADVDGKSLVVNDLHSIHAFGSLTDDVLALLHSEETTLILIDSHGHDDLVKNGQSPCQDIQMP